MKSVIGLFAAGLLLATAFGAAAAEFDAIGVFTKRCATCHTVGHGVEVGPDLKGVTERRKKSWLIPFIQSSQTVIQSGDTTANELFATFKHQKMPDHPYTAAQIEEILAFIAAGGPDSLKPKLRAADSATPAEVALGHDLFFGTRSFEAGGVACAGCHSIDGGRRSLGGDLRSVYGRYRDRELSMSLHRMRSPVMAALYGPRPLTDDEAFAVKAFLARLESSASGSGETVPGEAELPWAACLAGVVVFAAGDGRRWLRRRATADPPSAS